MNDYQNHFQNYSQTFDSTSAMQLAYLQATHGGAQLDDPSYSSGSWQHKSGYGEQSCGRVQGPSLSMGHHDSLLYASEFADPHSNLEISGYDSSSPYSYLPNSGYPMTLEDIDPGAVHQDNETVAAASYLPHEPIYGTSPLSASSARYHLDTPSDSLALSWPNNKLFQVSPVSGAPTVRCSPMTVKSQRPGSQDFSGFDTPPSPFSLGHSKHSSSSPSPGPLTPAVGHATLQADLYPLEGRPPSQGSSRNLYARNEDIDPDRPYPCSSCRMAFARQHDLTRHSRVHSGETPYHCHGCRQGFRRSDARSRHWGKDGACLALHQRLVEGTEEGRKLQKSLSRLGEKAGRVGTSTFRVKPQTRGIDN